MSLPRRIYVWHIIKETIPLIHPILNQWLDIYQHNIPTTSPLINAEEKWEKRKGDDLKSKDKDSNTGGTAGVHVEDTTTTEESIAPSRGASIGTHVLETNQQSFRLLRTVDDILGAHPMDGNEFWGNTNPGDVSIDTANSKEIMVESHITELHTHKHKEPVPPEL